MRHRLKKGYVHVYTGDGRGKTTASMGLGLRAACAGLDVCMFQFLKKRRSASEQRIRMPSFKVICLDQAHPIFGGKKDSLCGSVAEGLKKVKNIIETGRYDVIILDEIINCVSEGFIGEDVVLDLISSKPAGTELILTGRGATKAMMARADYVTRLNKVKHPFDLNVPARRGIEY